MMEMLTCGEATTPAPLQGLEMPDNKRCKSVQLLLR